MDVMTLKQARELIREREYPVTIARTPHDEYRVNIRGGSEDTAYYTSDIDDALGTALIMGRREVMMK